MKKFLLWCALLIVAYCSFVIGILVWNPMVRNQPKNLDVVSASNLVEVKSAIEQYHSQNQILPDSIDELVKAGVLSVEKSVDGYGRVFMLQTIDEATIKVYSTDAFPEATDDNTKTIHAISILVSVKEV